MFASADFRVPLAEQNLVGGLSEPQCLSVPRLAPSRDIRYGDVVQLDLLSFNALTSRVLDLAASGAAYFFLDAYDIYAAHCAHRWPPPDTLVFKRRNRPGLALSVTTGARTEHLAQHIIEGLRGAEYKVDPQGLLKAVAFASRSVSRNPRNPANFFNMCASADRSEINCCAVSLCNVRNDLAHGRFGSAVGVRSGGTAQEVASAARNATAMLGHLADVCSRLRYSWIPLQRRDEVQLQLPTRLRTLRQEVMSVEKAAVALRSGRSTWLRLSNALNQGTVAREACRTRAVEMLERAVAALNAEADGQAQREQQHALASAVLTAMTLRVNPLLPDEAAPPPDVDEVYTDLQQDQLAALRNSDGMMVAKAASSMAEDLRACTVRSAAQLRAVVEQLVSTLDDLWERQLANVVDGQTPDDAAAGGEDPRDAAVGTSGAGEAGGEKQVEQGRSGAAGGTTVGAEADTTDGAEEEVEEEEEEEESAFLAISAAELSEALTERLPATASLLQHMLATGAMDCLKTVCAALRDPHTRLVKGGKRSKGLMVATRDGRRVASSRITHCLDLVSRLLSLWSDPWDDLRSRGRRALHSLQAWALYEKETVPYTVVWGEALMPLLEALNEMAGHAQMWASRSGTVLLTHERAHDSEFQGAGVELRGYWTGKVFEWLGDAGKTLEPGGMVEGLVGPTDDAEVCDVLRYTFGGKDFVDLDLDVRQVVGKCALHRGRWSDTLPILRTEKGCVDVGILAPMEDSSRILFSAKNVPGEGWQVNSFVARPDKPRMGATARRPRPGEKGMLHLGLERRASTYRQHESADPARVEDLRALSALVARTFGFDLEDAELRREADVVALIPLPEAIRPRLPGCGAASSESAAEP